MACATKNYGAHWSRKRNLSHSQHWLFTRIILKCTQKTGNQKGPIHKLQMNGLQDHKEFSSDLNFHADVQNPNANTRNRKLTEKKAL